MTVLSTDVHDADSLPTTLDRELHRPLPAPVEALRCDSPYCPNAAQGPHRHRSRT